MSLTLVRHTRPDIAEGVCYGMTDLGLAPGMEAEAERIAAELPRPARIVTSPLTRCRLLAEALGGLLGVAPEVDARVREMDFGAWEGLAWADIPRAELDAWSADFLHARPHGGESVAMLRARTLEALAEFRGRGEVHAVVTHMGVIKAATTDSARSEDWRFRLPFGAVMRV